MSPPSSGLNQSPVVPPFGFNATRGDYRSPAFSSGSFISQWSHKSPLPLDAPSESCPDWHRWTDLLPSHLTQSIWIDYLVYIFFSLSFAGLSSLLTVYLSRSTQIHASQNAESDSNDSSSTIRNDFDEARPVSDTTDSYFAPLLSHRKSSKIESSSIKVPPKISYFAAGSGIPEVKCILSGQVPRAHAFSSITRLATAYQ